MIHLRSLFAVLAAVVLVAALALGTVLGGGATVVSGPRQSTACACTTVGTAGDGGLSGAANVVVIVTGSDSVSIDQRAVQSDGHTSVDIGVEYDGGSATIAGTTAENGSLVFTVEGTGADERVVVDDDERRTVTFHLGRDGVRITNEPSSEEFSCSVRSEADDVSVDVDSDGVAVDVGGDDPDDAASGFDCSRPRACACSDSTTDISAPPRGPSGGVETDATVMRAVVDPSELVGMAMPGRPTDCAERGIEVTTDCSRRAQSRPR